MNRLEKNIEIIHDLLEIHLERALTYERMMLYGNHDEKVSGLLKKMASLSRNCILELRSQISDTTGSDPADKVEIRGEVLNEWKGLQLFLADSKYQDVISCFEINEVRTTQAYQKALTCGDKLCSEVRLILRSHLDNLRRSYTFIIESREKPFVPEALPGTDERKPPAFFHDRLYVEI